MFREEKSPEDEIKAWQFWHSRQHSVKQRILDAGKFFFNTSYQPKTNKMQRIDKKLKNHKKRSINLLLN